MAYNAIPTISIREINEVAELIPRIRISSPSGEDTGYEGDDDSEHDSATDVDSDFKRNYVPEFRVYTYPRKEFRSEDNGERPAWEVGSVLSLRHDGPFKGSLNESITARRKHTGREPPGWEWPRRPGYIFTGSLNEVVTQAKDFADDEELVPLSESDLRTIWESLAEMEKQNLRQGEESDLLPFDEWVKIEMEYEASMGSRSSKKTDREAPHPE
ncbi:hypothetical protein MMC14_003969 [Varicellaria rhodocarpa]|nr:hypothetical protein [Varicellaria rhodocarpa]